MKQLMSCDVVAVNDVEYVITAQKKISLVYEFVRTHIKESNDKKKTLEKLQKASHWVASSVALEDHITTQECP